MIQSKASRNHGGNEANIIWGSGPADLEEGEIEMTIIATGFDSHDNRIEPVGPITTGVLTDSSDNAGGGEVASEERTIPTAPVVATKWNIKERYNDIDTLLMQPAFFRMGIQLGGSVTKGSAKVQVDSADSGESKSEPQAPKASEQSLF